MARVVALDLDRPELCPNEQARVKAISSPPDSQVQWFVDIARFSYLAIRLLSAVFLGVAISEGQSLEITAKLENSLSKTVRKKVASVDVELDPPPVNNKLPPGLLDDARAL